MKLLQISVLAAAIAGLALAAPVDSKFSSKVNN
jgi:hypothetical protein